MTARAAVLIAALALAGCAGLPRPSGPQPDEFAGRDYAATTLYRMSADQVPADGRSGFRLLPVASYAFATRAALAQSAEQTLDVQYYLLKNDNTGRSLLRALYDAARRGVRVRLLLDDLYSVGEDRILSDLAEEPHIEVRLYNPFVTWRSTRSTRLLGAAFELARIDRRMHNKLFIADNAAAVMGGRNIADEYFMRGQGENFLDLDLFVVGPAVRELSASFDTFWNSAMVVPLKRIIGPTPDADQAGLDFESATRGAAAPPLDVLPPILQRFGSLPAEIAKHQLDSLTLAHYTVLVDRPDKTGSWEDKSFPTVTRSVLAMLGRARQEAVIVSPYFVPGELGMGMMHAARVQGGRIVLITNSLASTDAPLAEIGYMRYRKAMLEEGVIIHELSPSRVRERNRFGPFGSSSGSLHAKVIVTDQKTIFIGSMNLDFRSAYENTEVGVIFESPEIASQLLGLVDAGSFYDLRLGPAGNVEWITHGDSQDQLYDVDPETSWFDRLLPQLLEPFVPEDEL